MDWEALSAVAEIAGVVLVVVSLVYLAIQVRQSNEMALAESERELLESWANAVAGISADDRTTDIFHRRMDSKSLVGSEEVEIFGDICLAMILTPGGRQWWSIIGPYFTIHDQMNERIEKEGDSFPSWVDMIPFARPEPAATAERL